MKESILYVELPESKELLKPVDLNIPENSLDIVHVKDLNAAQTAISSSPKFMALVCNTANKTLFEAFKKAFPSSPICLVTNKPMETYSRELESKEELLLSHVIANRLPSVWTIQELKIFLLKLLKLEKVFGIAPYLRPDAPTFRLPISRGTASAERELYNNKVLSFAEEQKLGHMFAQRVAGISEELLMNALQDAPRAAKDFNISSDADIFLSFGCDENTFAISVEDPYGALSKEKLFQYLKKVIIRQDDSKLIDTKKEGAGLGLYKILYSSHAFICNVVPRQKTEVVALIDLHFKIKDFSKIAKSIHFFVKRDRIEEGLKSINKMP
ncbi:MAG: hypothetical protein KA436_11580 [Oligoflexales bacterium]|nr:hypothetical protein [Oligoflexales bacterium]